MDDIYNVKEEIIDRISKEILCAKLNVNLQTDIIGKYDTWEVILNVGYTEEDYKDFLETLDHQGYTSYGSTIWYKDGTWAEHETVYYDYESCSTWVLRSRPKIPDDIK